MNKIIYAVILATLVCYGCPGPVVDPDEDEQAEIIESLQGSWSSDEIRKDNNVISDFSGFTLTISGQNYTTQNGTPVWPTNGSFDFETVETINDFVREDGRLFTASINASTLNIRIVYQEDNARGEYGTYEFTLEKE